MNPYDPAADGGNGLWGFANRLLVVLIVLALLAGAGLSYLPLIQENRSLRIKLAEKRTRLTALQTEFRNLQSTANALQTDRRAIERAAREQGMAKPDETIIRFEAPRR